MIKIRCFRTADLYRPWFVAVSGTPYSRHSVNSYPTFDEALDAIRWWLGRIK